MRFSIIIPTQDRPELLAAVVRHATQIEHPNFEVVVSDNSTSADVKRANADLVRSLGSARSLRLISPSRVLSLPEHFEFALDFATGDHIAYVTDKMVVLPRILSDAEAAIRTSGADIVNWNYASYVVDDIKHPAGRGTLTVDTQTLGAQATPFDPISALRFKARGAVPRGMQSMRDYVLGKIVFGCYSRSLIERIRSRSGTLFRGATHDYSAMIQALSLARGCVMLNRSEFLFVVLPRNESLGSRTATEPRHALQYFRSLVDADSILTGLLVPGLYASQHNMVAHDYKKFLPLYGNWYLFNETNWLSAIRSDLLGEGLLWSDAEEKNDQLRLFEEYLTRTGRRRPLARKLQRDRLKSTLETWWLNHVLPRLCARSFPTRETETTVMSSLGDAVRRVMAGAVPS